MAIFVYESYVIGDLGNLAQILLMFYFCILRQDLLANFKAKIFPLCAYQC